MNTRRKAFLISILQLIIFSILSLGMVAILFHAALLSSPIMAFMWTFWGFSIFTILTGVEIDVKYVSSFAGLNLIAFSIGLVFLITSFEDTKNVVLREVVAVLLIPFVGLYVFLVSKVMKKYATKIIEEAKKVLGKNGNKKALSDN